MDSVGANLRRLRKAKKLSQKQLAERSGVSQQLISQLETSQNETTKELPALAFALGVAVDEIDPSYAAHRAGHSILAPLISWVSAGDLVSTDLSSIDLEGSKFIPSPDLDPKGEWIALRVSGDSMDRISPPDSIIFVNLRDRRLVPNACYLFGDDEGGVTYKRYRPNPPRFEPVSTNVVHEPYFWPAGVEPKIIGRVMRSRIDM